MKVVANCSDGLLSEDKFEDTFTIRNTPHTISKPDIISPLPGEISESPVLIKWSSSVESWGFLVKYSLYYSTDNGTSWDLIVKDTYFTNYSWGINQSIDRFFLKVTAFSQGGIGNETISGPYTFQIKESPDSRIGLDSQFYIFAFILIGVSIVILSKRKIIKNN